MHLRWYVSSEELFGPWQESCICKGEDTCCLYDTICCSSFFLFSISDPYKWIQKPTRLDDRSDDRMLRNKTRTVYGGDISVLEHESAFYFTHVLSIMSV